MGEIVRRVAFLYATAIGIALVVVSVLRIVPPEVHRLVNRYGICAGVSPGVVAVVRARPSRRTLRTP